MIRLAAALAFVAAPVAAETACGRYADLTGFIAGPEYRETILGSGWSDGSRVEMWINPDTGTWSVLAVSRDGRMACLATSGGAWQFGKVAVGDPA